MAGHRTTAVDPIVGVVFKFKEKFSWFVHVQWLSVVFVGWFVFTA
jgi:hypothetical protein